MRRLAFVLCLLGSCSGVTEDPATGDASAQLACRDFYAIVREIDLINDAELRDRLQTVWDHAELSETPGIASAARDMLAGITAGDTAQLESGVEAMNDACQPVEPL
jgi:hypothetical protein